MTVEVALLLFNVVLLLAVLAISIILFSRRSAAPDLTLLATRADVERSERSARDGVGVGTRMPAVSERAQGVRS